MTMINLAGIVMTTLACGLAFITVSWAVLIGYRWITSAPEKTNTSNSTVPEPTECLTS